LRSISWSQLGADRISNWGENEDVSGNCSGLPGGIMPFESGKTEQVST
jgi:hypothetical protein